MDLGPGAGEEGGRAANTPIYRGTAPAKTAGDAGRRRLEGDTG